MFAKVQLTSQTVTSYTQQDAHGLRDEFKTSRAHTDDGKVVDPSVESTDLRRVGDPTERKTKTF